jgi:hypothetical protein
MDGMAYVWHFPQFISLLQSHPPLAKKKKPSAEMGRLFFDLVQLLCSSHQQQKLLPSQSLGGSSPSDAAAFRDVIQKAMACPFIRKVCICMGESCQGLSGKHL